MSFVLKRIMRVPFAKEGQSFVLIMRRVRLEKVLALLNEQVAKLGDATEQARERGANNLTLPAELLREVTAVVREAAIGWEGIVDESGATVPFSSENFDEVFGYDLEFFGVMLSALLGAQDLKES
jgi:hypothetical protein